MSRLQPVRGTHDRLPEDSRQYQHVVSVARDWAERYGCGEISTPIFEFTEVFQRTLGETSDVVSKEMYTFEDRGGDKITLRPEYTAGIARAIISGGLSSQLPLRFFAEGPIFRYERPQKGRLRQFHQIDVEFLGTADSGADIEVISLAADILSALGINNKTILEINSLGDSESRSAYRKCLVDYFTKQRIHLSEESQLRLDHNPLRILDSKNKEDKEIVSDAPLVYESFNDESTRFFSEVCSGLDLLNIPYKKNPRLVRGLDYYTHTTFEFTTSELGAQGAVIAGGRYDGLIEVMGGPSTPGIGWAGGIERILMLLESTKPISSPITLIPIGDSAEKRGLQLARELRGNGLIIGMDFSGNLKKRLKRANKVGSHTAIIFGDDELNRDVVLLRNLDSGEQKDVDLAILTSILMENKK